MSTVEPFCDPSEVLGGQDGQDRCIILLRVESETMRSATVGNDHLDEKPFKVGLAVNLLYFSWGIFLTRGLGIWYFSVPLVPGSLFASILNFLFPFSFSKLDSCTI
jgi:hypothetical protein